MSESVCNPILLTHDSRRVNKEFFCIFVISDRGLHLNCIVTISKLGETEAAKDVKLVDLIEKMRVPVGVKSNNCATKEVIMYSEFGHSGGIKLSNHLMG